jgi:uncharacterized integral membrane protein
MLRGLDKVPAQFKTADQIFLENYDFYLDFFHRQLEKLQTPEVKVPNKTHEPVAKPKESFRPKTLTAIDSILMEAILEDCGGQSELIKIKKIYDDLMSAADIQNKKIKVSYILLQNPSFAKALMHNEAFLRRVFIKVWHDERQLPKVEEEREAVNTHTQSNQDAQPPTYSEEPVDTQRKLLTNTLKFLIIFTIVTAIVAITVASCGFDLLAAPFLIPATAAILGLMASIMEGVDNYFGVKSTITPPKNNETNSEEVVGISKPHRKSASQKKQKNDKTSEMNEQNIAYRLFSDKPNPPSTPRYSSSPKPPS